MGVGVDNATGIFKGDVYVVDQGKSRIERFSPAGVWESDDVVLAGISPWIAVDDNLGLMEGDVYAVSSTGGVVDRFSPGLVLEEEIKGLHEPVGVAVDVEGHVFVSQADGKVLEFDSAGKPIDAAGDPDAENTVLEGLNGPQGLAVDAVGDLYVATAEGTVQYTLSGGTYAFAKTVDGGHSGLAVAPSGDVLVDRGGEFLEYDSAGTLLATGGAGTLEGAGGGLDVNGGSHDVYVANTSGDTVDVFEEGPTPEVPVTEPGEPKGSGLLLKGTLAAKTTGYYFAYNTGESCEGGATTSPQAASSGQVSSEASGLQPATSYSYCLVASNQYGSTTGSAVSLETASVPPEITGESFTSVGDHGVSLSAQIDPENLPGSYYYEYGTTSTFNTTPLKTTPASYEQNTNPVTATGQLTELTPNTEYHVRLVATNSRKQTTEGPELTFKTIPPPPSLLPDNRTFEMVTPVNNHEADIHTPGAVTSQATTSGTPTRLPFEVAASGDYVAYIADPTVGGLGNGANGFGNQYLARRSSEGGWVQMNIQPTARNATVYQGFSGDLATGVLVSGNEAPLELPPLSPQAPGDGYRVLYACADSESACSTPEEALSPENFFRPLFGTPASRSAGEFGTQGFGRRGQGVIDHGGTEAEPVFAGSAGASSEGGVLFEANDALLKGSGTLERELAESVKQEIINNEDGNYLYDSVDSRLSLVDVLPGGGVAGDATFGGTPFSGNEFDPPDFSNVVSEDGSRIYWTDLHTGTVYARVDGRSTVQVSEGTEAARYWTSAADGRYAFYTESKVEGEGEGLFRFDVDDKTREVLAAPSASVLGVVGTSENGEDVYFVAEGVLSGANAQGASPTNEQPNLYLLRRGSAPVFVARLSRQDGNEMPPFIDSRNNHIGEFGDWQPALANRTAEVSADGVGVVFMSSESLPVVGFPGGFSTGGAVEVYMFDAGSGRLFCVSCSSSGETPAVTANGAAAYLPISWTDTYLPQWFSADGSRVFFDSVVPLVADDTNGRQDVYEWEREGTVGCVVGAGVNGGCVSLLSGGTSVADSWFVGASVGGNDVFVVTRAQLAPEDQNDDFDLYDARVDGVQRVSPPACTGTGCQGLPQSPPTFATPPSATFNGVGNFPAGQGVVSTVALTRAQKLAKALKECKKDKAKRKHAACAARARKRFGPLVRAKKKRAVKRKSGKRTSKGGR